MKNGGSEFNQRLSHKMLYNRYCMTLDSIISVLDLRASLRLCVHFFRNAILQSVSRSSSREEYQKRGGEGGAGGSKTDRPLMRATKNQETRVQHDGREEFLSLSQYIKYSIRMHETKEDIAEEREKSRREWCAVRGTVFHRLSRRCRSLNVL